MQTWIKGEHVLIQQSGYGNIIAIGAATIADIDEAGVWLFHGYHRIGPYDPETGRLKNPFMYGMVEYIVKQSG